MAEESGTQEERNQEQGNSEQQVAFSRGGSGLRDFNIEQARVMAVRTAQASPAIRRWILRKRMLFDVLSDSEDENTYTIVLAFRPSEDFEGTPGQERIKISKAGRFQSREVLSHPKSFKRFSFKRRTE